MDTVGFFITPSPLGYVYLSPRSDRVIGMELTGNVKQTALLAGVAVFLCVLFSFFPLSTLVFPTSSTSGAPLARSDSQSAQSAQPAQSAQSAQQSSPRPFEAVKSLKTTYSLDDPASPWFIVNKNRPIREDLITHSGMVPVNVMYATGTFYLKKDASDALTWMLNDANSQGVPIRITSGYRSFHEQKALHNNSLYRLGEATTLLSSARAGYSEHHTGLAVDLGGLHGRCRVQACFADTPEGQWLAANSWKYGYILRYRQGKTDITGFTFEPWHFRFVGTELAKVLHDNGDPTLEEFFGLPAAPHYPGDPQ